MLNDEFWVIGGPYLQLKLVSWVGQEGAYWGGLRTTSACPSGLENQASSCWMLETGRSPPGRITGLLGEGRQRRGREIKMRGRHSQLRVSRIKSDSERGEGMCRMSGLRVGAKALARQPVISSLLCWRKSKEPMMILKTDEGRSHKASDSSSHEDQQASSNIV